MAEVEPAVDAVEKADVSTPARDEEKKNGRQGWKNMKAVLALSASNRSRSATVGDRREA